MKRIRYVPAAVVFAVFAVLAVGAFAQTDPSGVCPPSGDFSLPQRGTMTVSITDSGIEPESTSLPYGDYTVRVTNNSSGSRGLAMTGHDLGNSPFIRFTHHLRPGDTAEFGFFFAPGAVEMRDYVSGRERPTAAGDVVYGSFTRTVTFTGSVPTPREGAGPDEGTMDEPVGTVAISLTDTGIRKEVGQTTRGHYTFTVTNDSSRPRGLQFSGTERTGTPYVRFVGPLQPGESASFTHFFGPGKLVLRDFVDADRTERGLTNVRYGSHSSSIVFTTASGAVVGAGPSTTHATRGPLNISLTNSGIRKTVGEAPMGDYRVKVTNNSSRTRGLVMTGTDVSGTKFVKFTRLLRPGQSTSFDSHFAPDKVVLRDFTGGTRVERGYTNVSYGPHSSSIVFVCP